MYGSVEQAFVGRDEPKNGCEGGYIKNRLKCKWQSVTRIPFLEFGHFGTKSTRYKLKSFRDITTGDSIHEESRFHHS